MVKLRNRLFYGEIIPCRKCNIEMPFTRENFKNASINKNTPLGLERICKKCRNEYERERLEDNLIAKQKHKKYHKDYSQTLEGIYRTYKASAKYKNRYFELTLEDFEEFWQANCYYCNNKLITVGFDRIDSSIGYIRENVVPSCYVCNKMKMDRNQEEFLNYCKLIADNHFKEG